jgi:hypothetical protein
MHISRSIWLLAASAALLACGTVNAATLTLDFDTSFGDQSDPGTAPPDGGTPWFTAVFDDGGSPGTVTLTMTLASTVGTATVDGVYFNLDPAMDAALLTIAYDGLSSTAPEDHSIGQATDGFKPDSDGFMDIFFNFPPPGGQARFEAGEVAVYDISGAGLVASSFDFLSTPDPLELNPTGPWKAAAKIQSTGSTTVICDDGVGECSDWIAPAIIPVPAAAWLFGSALCLLGWMRRRQN